MPIIGDLHAGISIPKKIAIMKKTITDHKTKGARGHLPGAFFHFLYPPSGPLPVFTRAAMKYIQNFKLRNGGEFGRDLFHVSRPPSGPIE
jgi:hypothetical protein